MAVISLVPGTPRKETLASTYKTFTLTYGRNVLITCDEDFFYHPSNKDGAAVNANEQFKFRAGTYSVRLPGSGCGYESLDDGRENAFSLAAVSGTPDIWVLPVTENI